MRQDQVTRRQVITGAAAGAVVVLVDRSPLAAADRAAGSPRHAPRIATAAFANPPTRTLRVVRATDQLDVVIELFDVSLGANQLTVSGAQPAVRLTFGSQHTAERMFTAAVPSVPTTSINHTAAGTSVVVVPVPGTTSFTLDALLALAEDALTVQTTAATPDGGATALEIPTGIAISPTAATTLTASRTPFTVGNTTEVWLAKFQGSGGNPVEAVAVSNRSPVDLLTSRIPDTDDRDDIVENTTGGQGDDAPFVARRLWLSSSGAFARITGDWPTKPSLVRWEHRIATGRDLYVEITTVGYLAPFGHRAAVVDIADRVFATDTGGGQTSIMKRTSYLTILDDVVVFDDGPTLRPYQQHEGRAFPFATVRATVDETVPITLAAIDDLNNDPINSISDVKVTGSNANLVVSYVAVDRDANRVKFTLPATFVDGAVAHHTAPSAAPAKFIDVFNGDDRMNYREVDLQGQGVAYADPLAPGTGSTTKKTHTLRFKLRTTQGASNADLETAGLPAFNPEVTKAWVVDETIGAVNGTAADSFPVTLHDRWLLEGNGPDNFDLSFLKLDTPNVGQVGTGPATSVAALQLVAEVFNQSAGVGPDLPLPTSPWNPDTALGAGSKLLGGLLLSELLDAVPAAQQLPGVSIPGTEVTVVGDVVTVVFSFTPKLTTNELLGFIATPDTRCRVTVTTVASISGAFPAVVTTEISVSAFTMVFPPGGVVGIIEIDFDSITVTAPSNDALRVDPQMSGWRLGDDLGFLQPVFDVLESLGGLGIELNDDYVDVDASINLPSMELGMVAIRNFHLDFGLGLPLDGNPLTLHAGVGSSASPIEVKIGIFGGSFYVTLDLEYTHPAIDWRVEAGVSAFMEIGFDAIVVSAAVRLRISMKFTFDKAAGGNTTKFAGAVSLEGEIGLLGVVEVSVAIVASVSYNSHTEKAIMKGEIHWSVDTPFGGPDGVVKLGQTEIVLGDGAGTGPSRLPHGVAATTVADTAGFGDLYTVNDWTDYSSAFA